MPTTLSLGQKLDESFLVLCEKTSQGQFRAVIHSTLYGKVIYLFDDEESLGFYANSNPPYFFFFLRKSINAVIQEMPESCGILFNPSTTNEFIPHPTLLLEEK